ncbi:hypothetical protein CFO_g868 [Ceratocystis platani]|uniref:Uncharacterized protein n=1 Tax=Ceratocystis fimbriata f. sp. platani TaxID=88771 RepID=A0A0F8D225_CERFI|nr:hypothetical protein CFO_g868 [Ceratocystis platani]
MHDASIVAPPGDNSTQLRFADFDDSTQTLAPASLPGSLSSGREVVADSHKTASSLPQQQLNLPPPTGIVIFSGGSAANTLVDVFEDVRQANKAALTYVLPISDNGGSSSEIIRVFGGPGIGDVRSRLVRLIPDNGSAENSALKALFNHRLVSDSVAAGHEWDKFLDGSHPAWLGISTPKLQLIRSILNSFNFEAIKRTRPSSRFDFGSASLGNIFLTGARLFTGSFEAAIYLLSSICSVPASVDVVPALNTNFAHHIAAGLADGSVIAGDDEDPLTPNNGMAPVQEETAAHEEEAEAEDANLPGSLPALRKAAIAFSKEHEEDLPARIQRLWYINPYGQEIRISANPRVLDALAGCGTVIFSIGSLFTSIIPSLVLKGVGHALSRSDIRNKVLILNATVDREVGPSSNPYTAVDFVRTVAEACGQSMRPGLQIGDDLYSQFVTHLIYLDCPSSPKVDRQQLASMGWLRH